MPTAARNLSQRFPERRVFVTGAASGLGLAFAEILARENWRLVLTDIDAVRLSIVAARLSRDGVAVASQPCDVRDAPALGALIDEAADALGGIDVAIHCAGVAAVGPFHSSSAQDWQWVFDVNVQGIANACRAVIAHMRSGGLIVNVAGAAAFCTPPQLAAYSASQAAIVALSESLQQEYGAQGLQVMIALPGWFRTRLIESARGPQRALQAAQRRLEEAALEPATVAEYLLTRAAARCRYCIYPPRYRWLWRAKRLAPVMFQRWFAAAHARARRDLGH
ncbi:MAG: SDR family NAD(P)-dependent oxidoreductase [Steroidobacteraceae bacterium]|nr:SDR family NAD(P)-dependent oxidoreductase [Steroidobacteraceae bacterium]MDW8260747.1 SDR family NAD(P)-dependent oxidoreductase [Gammaproteobacteria bacterium]